MFVVFSSILNAILWIQCMPDLMGTISATVPCSIFEAVIGRRLARPSFSRYCKKEILEEPASFVWELV